MPDGTPGPGKAAENHSEDKAATVNSLNPYTEL